LIDVEGKKGGKERWGSGKIERKEKRTKIKKRVGGQRCKREKRGRKKAKGGGWV